MRFDLLHSVRAGLFDTVLRVPSASTRSRAKKKKHPHARITVALHISRPQQYHLFISMSLFHQSSFFLAHPSVHEELDWLVSRFLCISRKVILRATVQSDRCQQLQRRIEQRRCAWTSQRLFWFPSLMVDFPTSRLAHMPAQGDLMHAPHYLAQGTRAHSFEEHEPQNSKDGSRRNVRDGTPISSMAAQNNKTSTPTVATREDQCSEEVHREPQRDDTL